MNTDIEDLLREGMERFTADLRAPAGLTYRIVRRRRRRLALRSMTGGVAVLAAGAAALAVIVLPRVNGTGQQAVDAAYVVKNVSNALTTAAPGTIAQMTITTSGGPNGTTTAEEWSNGSEWRSVTYSSPGHPAYDDGYGTASGYTLVSYLTRTWAREDGTRPAVRARSRLADLQGRLRARERRRRRAVPAGTARHEHLRQLAAHDHRHGVARRGLLRVPGRDGPANRRTGSRRSS